MSTSLSYTAHLEGFEPPSAHRGAEPDDKTPPELVLRVESFGVFFFKGKLVGMFFFPIIITIIITIIIIIIIIIIIPNMSFKSSFPTKAMRASDFRVDFGGFANWTDPKKSCRLVYYLHGTYLRRWLFLSLRHTNSVEILGGFTSDWRTYMKIDPLKHGFNFQY